MILLSHSSSSSIISTGLFAEAAENVYEQRSSTFSALFKFDPVRGDGNMTNEEIAEWEDVSSAFFAQMFDQINDNENTTDPMLAPGVIIEVTQQDRYEARVTNNGDIDYGVSLEVTFLATYQRNPESGNINVGNRVLQIFDRDNNGNLVFFSPYLSQLRLNAALSTSFTSVNKMSISVSAPRPIDLASPIPTLPLPPPTDAPSETPSRSLTSSPSPLPTKNPAPAPSAGPTFFPTHIPPAMPMGETLEPTAMPNPEPTTNPPTPPPTTTSPKAPEYTMSPTLSPDLTASPTKNPTAAPTLPLESFFAPIRLSLDQVMSVLDLNATDAFQSVTAAYLSIHIQELLKDTTVEEVTVGLFSQNLLSDVDRRRRKLQDPRPVMRRIEEEKNGQEEEDVPKSLQVEFNTILKIRTTSSVNAPSLVQSAFGTTGRRETYRRLLVATEDPILKTIALVELSDGNINNNNKGIVPEQPDSGLSTPALIGIGVGLTLFAVAILGIWYQANNRKDDSGDSQKGQIPTAKLSGDEASVPKGRLDAEIVVDKSEDDVSTLGDPIFGMTLEERTCADKTATSASVKESYDFMKLMGKGANALLGTTTVEGDEEEDTASKVRRNTLFADDDASFEDMFGEMK